MIADSNRGAVIRALLDGRSFVLPLHLSPDGDSLGSSLALARGLMLLGKTAIVVSKDPVPAMFSFLPEAKEVIPLSASGDGADTVVLIDSSDPQRAGMEPADVAGKTLVNIDHHLSNAGFCEICYVDSSRASSAELVYDLLVELGVAIDASIANLLYLGVMTDTGSFRFDNTGESALLSAARLVAHGARPSYLARMMYETKSFSSLKLTGAALDNLRLSSSGKVCWTSITNDMLSRCGASDDESDGIVNLTRMVSGVEVGVLFKQIDEGSVRVGLRSKEHFDCSRVAASYGGGGHARAAGFTWKGTLEQAEEVVISRLSDLLSENE